MFFIIRNLFTGRINLTGSIGLAVLVCYLLTFSGCSVQTMHRELTYLEDIRRLNTESVFLKAHMRDGQLYILSGWQVDRNEEFVSGEGTLLNFNRDTVGTGHFSVPLDSVAIFETNEVRLSGSVYAMAVITGISLGVTAFCIANPKACFGSCPTFYVADGNDSLLVAEGFSSSVAPSLEAVDIDALYRVNPTGRDFALQMKNEALETHMVRYLDLLAVPKPVNGRVFAAADGVFRQEHRITNPISCRGPEGDFLDAIISFDGMERSSKTDSTYLGAREIIELEFGNFPGSDIGLVIGSRQTLLSTYLFYQTLDYMGNSVGQWFAFLERGDQSIKNSIGSIGKVLGGIEVLLPDSVGDWIYVAEIHETGPLAADIRLIPLPDFKTSRNRIRLRLTRGHWRLDYIALVEMGETVEPVRIRPQAVYYGPNRDISVLAKLHDSSQFLITLPGDNYTINYRLPEKPESYELFLESRGYYIEWIREEWLAEEDPARTVAMFLNPEAALRELAGDYKLIEDEMELLFWNSRYAR